MIGRCFVAALLAVTACELPTSKPSHAALPAAPIDARRSDAAAGSVVDVSDRLEPRNWFPAHGATSDNEYDSSYGCEEIVVGPAHDPALVCTDVDNPSQYEAATHRLVRLVRGGKIVTVLDVQTRIEPLDGPIDAFAGDTPGVIDHKLTIAADGLSATVQPLDPKRSKERAKYVWKGQRFVRTR